MSSESVARVSAAAEAYELFKHHYLNTEADCRAQDTAFLPIIAETSGGWGPTAIGTIKRLSRTVAIRSDCCDAFLTIIMMMMIIIINNKTIGISFFRLRLASTIYVCCVGFIFMLASAKYMLLELEFKQVVQN